MLQPETQLLVRFGSDLGPAVHVLACSDPHGPLALEDVGVDLAAIAYDDIARATSAKRQCPDRAQRVHFDAAPAAWKTIPNLVIYLPKSKTLFQWLLRYAARVIAHDGVVWVVGRKQGGAGSAGRPLRDVFAHVEKVDAARHCMLYRAIDPMPAADSADDGWSSYLAPNPPELNVMCAPGVFSYGRLDGGTAALLNTLSEPTRGPILDVGCGAGVMGAWLALRDGVQATLTDSSAYAVRSATETIRRAGLDDRCTVLACDGVPLEGLDGMPPGTRFRTIVCNPPFHQGLDRDTSIFADFCAGAASRLHRDGNFVFVFNRFLPYLDTARAWFDDIRVAFEDTKFRVAVATGPRPRSAP